MEENKNVSAKIEPVRLGLNSRFQFKCHPGVSCFTQCCRGINIILTPYDVIRLKSRLDLPSDQFLAIYTKPHLLEKTDLPVITLKHRVVTAIYDSDSHSARMTPMTRLRRCGSLWSTRTRWSRVL